MIVLTFAPAAAHGPLFSPAPETIWEGGTELSLGYQRKEAGPERDQEAFIEAKQGLTAQWEIIAEAPYAWARDSGIESNGIGDITLGTKYQF